MPDQPLSQRLRDVRDARAVSTESSPPRRVPLGQLLVEKRVLSESDLTLALEQQRRNGRPLGQILLEMGAVSAEELARTLTEQHGFDFTVSLRRRLGSSGETGAADGDRPSRGAVEGPAECYLVRESSDAESLRVAESFLDAADAAFELIDERNPERLEIVRAADGELELFWSYRRDASDPARPVPDAAA